MRPLTKSTEIELPGPSGRLEMAGMVMQGCLTAPPEGSPTCLAWQPSWSNTGAALLPGVAGRIVYHESPLPADGTARKLVNGEVRLAAPQGVPVPANAAQVRAFARQQALAQAKVIAQQQAAGQVPIAPADAVQARVNEARLQAAAAGRRAASSTER